MKGKILESISRSLRGLLSHPAGIAALTSAIAMIWFFFLGGRQAVEEKGKEFAVNTLAAFAGAWINAAGLSIEVNRTIWSQLIDNLTRLPTGPLV